MKELRVVFNCSFANISSDGDVAMLGWPKIELFLGEGSISKQLETGVK